MKSGFLMIYLLLAMISEVVSMPPAQKAENDLSGIKENILENNAVGEGLDYATRTLGDAWDMQSFSDIAQWFNHTPPEHQLVDFQVNNGVFSARTLGDYSEFFPLFPGYLPGTHSGKIGALYPINSSVFACFYMSMYSTWNSPISNYFLVGWGPNDDTNNPWGVAQSYDITKDEWRLYQFSLNNPRGLINQPWSSQQLWQYLRITPSKNAETRFSIDWIRLTNCQPVYVNLSGIKPGTYSLWLSSGSHDGHVLVVSSFSTTGSYAWDVQGLAAGSYTYYVKNSDGVIFQQGQINIVESPIVTFTSPSPYSGQYYANNQGNPWNMDPSDAPDIRCVKNTNFAEGILTLDTMSQDCAGPGANEADPIIYLDTVYHGDLSSYRYLSFSSNTTGYPWSVPDLGMIVRLFWSLDRTTGVDCWYGSRAVALDVGWQTYTVDLYDAWNTMPEERTPLDCPMVSWRDQGVVGPVVSLRIDPNENITGNVMHQEFDWIRLSKVEQVTQGRPAKIRVMLNKPPTDVTLSFYYTADLSQPAQNIAASYPKTINSARYIRYFPFVSNFDLSYAPYVDQIPADVTFSWNTSGVAPGEYYLCAQADDGYNRAIYCSQAPIQIIPGE
jgi:hypothetical protein